MQSLKLTLLMCFWLVGSAWALPALGQDDRAAETAHLEGEAREIADWVIACQRAGWEDFDIETYLSQWAEDATVVMGRLEDDGEHDVVYSHEQIVATRSLRMRGENPGIQLRYLDVVVEIDGDFAVMRTRTITSTHDSEYKEIMAERFTLRRSEGSWLVVEDRVWLVGELRDGERIPYNAEVWDTLDQELEVSQDDLEDWEYRDALVRAFRFFEAYEQSVLVSESPDAIAEDWSRRGLYAVLVGEVDDAVAAFSEAWDLDPEVWLPYYAMPEDEAE